MAACCTIQHITKWCLVTGTAHLGWCVTGLACPDELMLLLAVL
jgi:hypothetical protein